MSVRSILRGMVEGSELIKVFAEAHLQNSSVRARADEVAEIF